MGLSFPGASHETWHSSPHKRWHLEGRVSSGSLGGSVKKLIFFKKTLTVPSQNETCAIIGLLLLATFQSVIHPDLYPCGVAECCTMCIINKAIPLITID